MRLKALLAVGVVLFLFASCAKDSSRARHQSEAERLRFVQAHHLGKLPPSDIPLVLNDRVYAWLDYFQGAGRRHFQRYMERSGRYMKVMQDILKQNGLPKDLIYVAMIESGFNNNAYSRAAAVGPWQFIRGTGSRYGLDIGGYEDERRHPVKATWAAAKYLRDLYDEFGDWYLAMAGYNAGEGRIRDAIAQTGSRNFWDIADSHLRPIRAETRDYVPKFIAAAIIAKMPENFGFSRIDYQSPLEYDTATVESQTDIDVIADCAGVSTGEIADLNPHLVRGTTPPGARNYEVNLPKGKVPAFKAKYAQLPEEDRVKIAYHRVKRGETVASIAGRYGVSKSALMAANDLSRKRHLHAGMTLVIPKGGSSAAYASNDNYNDNDGGSTTVRTKKLVKYRVKKGDTVSGIANRFDVTSAQVKSWNSITKKNPLRSGRVLKIYKPVYVKKDAPAKSSKQIAMADTGQAGGSHKIQAGDTLWTIAQRYGMSVEELASINGMDANAKIKPGQKVVVKMAQGRTAIEAQGGDSASAEPAQTSAPKTDEADQTNTTIARAAASEASPDDIDLSASPSTKLGTSNASKADREKVTATKTYKVKKGDSLGAVARKHGVSVSDLMKWNGIKNPKAVRSGQVLKIKTTETRTKDKDVVKKEEIKVTQPVVTPEMTGLPPKDEGVPVKLSDIPLPAQESRLDYKVKDGDTLWDIARRHKVTIAEIQKWNNLSDPSAVKPGTTLTINSHQ